MRPTTTPSAAATIRAAALAGLALGCAAGGAPVQPEPLSSLDPIFAANDRTDAPGCAVAVLRDGDVVVQRAYGMADIGLGVPYSSASVTWIPYSEARVFTGLAVAMLAREGRIDLDDPVRQHVPEVPAYASDVTVRQLIHHTSGIPDYGVLAGPGWDIFDRMDEAEFFRIVARRNRLEFSPGSDVMYSNTDYALLRILVQRASGESLGAFLAERVFEPLGMTGTRVGAPLALVIPGRTPFYEPGPAGFDEVVGTRVSPVGGIAVTTNLDDLIRWEQALGERRLGVDSLLAMLKEGAPESDAETGGYAFGLYRATVDGRPAEIYRGVGEYMYLVRVPSERLAVATLCNAYRDMWSFGTEVAEQFLTPPAAAVSADTGAVAGSEPAEETAPVGVTVPVAELARYAGSYRHSDSMSVRLKIELAHDTLVATTPDDSRYPLLPLGDGRFAVVFPEGDWVRLTVSGPDSAGTLHLKQELPNGASAGPDLQGAAPWKPGAAELAVYAGRYAGEDVPFDLEVGVAGDSLVAWSRGLAVTELVPHAPDEFDIDSYRMHFRRDSAGRVTHLEIDATRVKDMRLERQP
jgi:CubicO group peptidase (beta-lactamase class C family)